MVNKLFNIKEDNERIANGGFFCFACLVEKPARELSPDARYCQGCFEFLKLEASYLSANKRPRWVPKKTIQGGKCRG